MSVLNGPGEGTWSVFAAKVVEERDEARHERDEARQRLERLLDKSADGWMARALDAERERDEWRSECASISEEFNLPAGIRPSEGEISQFLKDYEKARKERDERREKTDVAKKNTAMAAKAYNRASKELRSAFSMAYSSPKVALEKAMGIVNEVAGAFSSDQEISIVLLSDRMAKTNLHTHSVNVMLLSLLIAKARNASEQDLKDIGLGALFHDIGMLRGPDPVRRLGGGAPEPSGAGAVAATGGSRRSYRVENFCERHTFFKMTLRWT